MDSGRSTVDCFRASPPRHLPWQDPVWPSAGERRDPPPSTGEARTWRPAGLFSVLDSGGLDAAGLLKMVPRQPIEHGTVPWSEELAQSANLTHHYHPAADRGGRLHYDLVQFDVDSML